MLSGIVTINRYPRAAQVNASPIPVLPLVGSMITDCSLSRPCASAASIIATPIRSLTDQSGLKLSSFATTVAWHPLVTRLTRTSGVLPTVCVMSS